MEDRIYDRAIDNDDLDDYFRTFIKIKYCTKCGKILYKDHSNTTNRYIQFGFIIYKESSLADIREFEQITGLDASKITLLKK